MLLTEGTSRCWYAHEHGCPIDVDECLAVAENNGRAMVVEYLLAVHTMRMLVGVERTDAS
ncbi:hypothetical protein T492DRAFT_895661 [Pavlovales sp. CCMP2436]|nr:hypothetical protein T492DRAFT_895661 [Pavlovales sp. CCMP2436]